MHPDYLINLSALQTFLPEWETLLIWVQSKELVNYSWAQNVRLQECFVLSVSFRVIIRDLENFVPGTPRDNQEQKSCFRFLGSNFRFSVPRTFSIIVHKTVFYLIVVDFTEVSDNFIDVLCLSGKNPCRMINVRPLLHPLTWDVCAVWNQFQSRQ